MNLKDYLTPAQVKAYATTPKKALAISKKRWWQNTQLTQKQLVKMYDQTLGSEFCGLCVYYSCFDCPLKEIGYCPDKNSPYQITARAYIAFHKDKSEANYKAFIKAAKNMHKCLCELEKKK